KAMEAPTPVSAYLHSATMVKAGIFLLFRFTPVLGLSDFYIYSVTFVGLITMIFGAINAIRQYDLKAILAYSDRKSTRLNSSHVPYTTLFRSPKLWKHQHR